MATPEILPITPIVANEIENTYTAPKTTREQLELELTQLGFASVEQQIKAYIIAVQIFAKIHEEHIQQLTQALRESIDKTAGLQANKIYLALMIISGSASIVGGLASCGGGVSTAVSGVAGTLGAAGNGTAQQVANISKPIGELLKAGGKGVSGIGSGFQSFGQVANTIDEPKKTKSQHDTEEQRHLRQLANERKSTTHQDVQKMLDTQASHEKQRHDLLMQI